MFGRRQKVEAGAAEACHFCNERVYLVERMAAEGTFFHPGCFRCEYCGTALKMSESDRRRRDTLVVAVRRLHVITSQLYLDAGGLECCLF